MASNFLSVPKVSTTVILFWVNVPVLSEQITWVHPKVSTAVSFLTSACLLDIDVTPIERIMVITAGSPSGIAATARAIATKNVSKITSPAKDPFLINVNINTKILIPITSFVRVLESSAIFFWSGVSWLSVWAKASAILPISVSIPVETITALPRP